MPSITLDSTQGQGAIPPDRLEQLIDLLFRDQPIITQVRVTDLPEGHSGLSPIQIYLAYPLDRHGSELNPLLIRVGSQAALAQEHANYANFIQERTDFALVQERRYHQADDFAIIAYDYLGDQRQPLRTLREFLWRNERITAAAQMIQALFLDTLARVKEQQKNGWYNDARAHPNQRPIWYYNTMLPATLTLELADMGAGDIALPTVISLLEQADQPSATALIDQLVTLQNTADYAIEVVERHLQGSHPYVRLHIYAGVVQARSLYQPPPPIVARIDLKGTLAQIAQFLDNPDRPVVGRIIATRYVQLEQKHAQLSADLRRLADYDPPGYLPNPLHTYHKLLSQPRPLTTSIIHGDLNLSNILIRELGGRVRGAHGAAKAAALVGWLIDFDKTGGGAHAMFDAVKLETEYKIHILSHRFQYPYDFLRLEQILHTALVQPDQAERQLRKAPHLLDAYQFIATIRRSFLRQIPGCAATPAEYYLGLLAYGLAALKYRNLYAEGSNQERWLSRRPCVEHLATAAYLSASFAAAMLTSSDLATALESRALPASYPDIRPRKQSMHKRPWLVGRDPLLIEASQRLISRQARIDEAVVVLYGQPGSGRDAIAQWLKAELEQYGYTICEWQAPTIHDITLDGFVDEIRQYLQALGVAKPGKHNLVKPSALQQRSRQLDLIAQRDALVAELEGRQAKSKPVALVLRFYTAEPEIFTFLAKLVTQLNQTVLLVVTDNPLPELNQRSLEVRPLTPSDVQTYLYYERLTLDEEAMQRIYTISRGLPRLLMRAISDAQRYRQVHGGTLSEAIVKQPDQLPAELARDVLRYMPEAMRRMIGLDELIRTYSRDDQSDFMTIFEAMSQALQWRIPASLTDDIANYMQEREVEHKNDEILRPFIRAEALAELRRQPDFRPLCIHLAHFYQGLVGQPRLAYAIPPQYLSARYLALAGDWLAAAQAIRSLSTTPSLLYTAHCEEIYALTREILKQLYTNNDAALLEIAGRCAAYLGETNEARLYYQDLFERLYQQSDPEYIQLLTRLIQVNLTDDQYYEEARRLSDYLVDITDPSEAMHALGRALQGYTLIRANPQQAAELFEDAIRLFDASRERWGSEARFFEEQYALLADELAHIYVEQLPDMVDRAIVLLRRALSIQGLNPSILARIDNDLGYIYYYVRGDSHDVQRARTRFADALRLRERLGDRVGQIRSVQNLANVTVDLAVGIDDWNVAEQLFQKYEGQRWFDNMPIGDRELLISNHLHLLTIRGDFDRAHQLLKRGSSLHTSHTTARLWSHLNQADLAFWEQRPEQCQLQLNHSLTILKGTVQSPAEQCEWARIALQAHLVLSLPYDSAVAELLNWEPAAHDRPIDSAEWYLARGLWHLAEGNYPYALDALQSSHRLWQKCNYHFREAEVNYWTAYCYFQHSDRLLAKQTAQKTAALLLPFGETPLSRMLQQLQEQIALNDQE